MSRSSRSWCRVSVNRGLRWAVLSFLFAGHPGIAAPPERADSEVRGIESARARYRVAKALRQAGKPSEALAELQAAYAELPTPSLLFPIAELCAELQRSEEGLAALRRYRQQLAPSSMPAGQGLREVEALEQRLSHQPLQNPATVPPSEAPPALPAPSSPPPDSAPAPVPIQTSAPAPQVVVPPASTPSSLPVPFFPRAPTWTTASLTLATFLGAAVVGGIARERRSECQASPFCSEADYFPANVAKTAQAEEAARLEIATWALVGVGSTLLVVTAAVVGIEYAYHRQRRALQTRPPVSWAPAQGLSW